MSLLRRIFSAPARVLERLFRLLFRAEDEIADLKILAAQRLLESRSPGHRPGRLREMEFKAFSQFGDDGIIQYLIAVLAPLPSTFIEFGVQDYRESNTRFLLLHDNWRGLVIEASGSDIASIRRQTLYWRHDLTAVHSFITRENINELFLTNGFSGEIGLLSIDIDGNDYWVWEAITAVDPVIVVVEYNAVFGAQLAVTVPYEPSFERSKAHYSHLYWGSSLRALAMLAATKGYRFAGCNSAGNNAYFVRNDRAATLPSVTVEADFVESRFRESRDRSGQPSFLAGARRLQEIAGMPVYDVERKQVVPLQASQPSSPA